MKDIMFYLVLLAGYFWMGLAGYTIGLKHRPETNNNTTITACEEEITYWQVNSEAKREQLEQCINDLATLSYEQNADIVCMDEESCELKRE